MSNTKIYYTKPSITELEVGYATDAARNGWGDKCYEYIEKFEAKFKEFTGSKYAIATSSCTGAIHMGLAALGIGLDDEVILADTNWIASAAPITYLGAKPIFVDILPDTWCVDPARVEDAITDKTKAILAVHIYGNLCEMDKLLAIGDKYGIPVIEDAAEAIGSYWHDHHAGTLGQFGTFSFHGTKTLTTGEGGMFITNNPELHEKVLALSNHGRAKGQVKQFWPDDIGFKYKMSNIQAAIGCGQMERIDDLVSRKRQIFQAYQAGLRDISGFSMNPEKKGTINGYWMPTVVFEKSTGVVREKLQVLFSKKNVDARGFFYPLSSLPMFDDRLGNLNSWDIPNRAINLPSYHDLTEREIERVGLIIKSSLIKG
ncbi:MAG: DegT/DnrJ/EryC1/StrS family aminotransferase [Porticoccaceae bacterium]|nr:DegT/DnrJ/EryC1/StrS family aminotransferase [Porticoccaceae bacterium]